MPGERVLSQEEIDNVFRKSRPGGQEQAPLKAQVYDFRRPDRIAKDQLRAIHLLHENFARALASSLSAYLRAFVAVNLVSVEQLAFMEFARILPSPTVLMALGMKPYDGSAILELNPSLVFPVLEMLLGGTGQSAAKIEREITEIERTILDGLVRIILNDLRAAWQPVTTIDFSVESYETEPQLMQILAPNEAVVAIGMEVRLGETAGIMNLGIPSITVKMLRQKFDQQWTLRKSRVSEDDRARILRLVQPARMELEAALRGQTLSIADVLAMSEGDILEFDYPVDRPMDLLVNGVLKYRGELLASGGKRAFRTQELVTEENS